jgi:hypothetical protein
MKVRSVSVGRVWDCMLCTCVSEEGGDGEGASSDLKHHLCCHTHLDTSVSREEGGDGEGAGSEAPSLLSYTRRYVSLTELGHVPVWVPRTDAPVCIHEECLLIYFYLS